MNILVTGGAGYIGSHTPGVEVYKKFLGGRLKKLQEK